ncbi:hypothetical protein MKZ07_30205 [Paenibacillus sp. FSL P4-0338]|uniref:hypothetical protein n=1 Tax=Paenibacillus sp. FSL P4-0338 TaxID=2921635 RepID=UPI0030F94DE0
MEFEINSNVIKSFIVDSDALQVTIDYTDGRVRTVDVEEQMLNRFAESEDKEKFYSERWAP